MVILTYSSGKFHCNKARFRRGRPRSPLSAATAPVERGGYLNLYVGDVSTCMWGISQHNLAVAVLYVPHLPDSV